jgi:hypothetical protein
MIDPLAALKRIYNQSNELYAKLSFVPMIAMDNTTSSHMEQESQGKGSYTSSHASFSQIPSFLSINLMSSSTLLRLPSVVFLSHLFFNEALKNFLASFFLYRQRSIFDIISVLDEKTVSGMNKLERNVLLIYHRLLHDSYDAAPPMPSSSPTVSVHNPKSSVMSNSLTAFLDEDLKLLFCQMKELSLPYLLDLVNLAGDDNMELVADILSRVFQLRSGFKKEVIAAVKETNKTIHQLFQQMTMNPSTSTKKSQRPSSKQTATKTDDKLVALSPEDSFLFVADIILTWSSFLLCLTSRAHDANTSTNLLSVFLCGNMTGLTACGTELLGIFCDLYDTILSSSLKSLTSSSTSSSSTRDRAIDLQAVSMLRKRVLQVMNELILVSISRLQDLARAEIDMLMMSDWTLEGNCSWIDWIQRVLTNQATNESTSFGALLADYDRVGLSYRHCLQKLSVIVDAL